MEAPITMQPEAAPNLNHLQLGLVYLAITPDGTAVGEYLGMESPHGDAAILLRHGAETLSIDLRDVQSILPTAA